MGDNNNVDLTQKNKTYDQGNNANSAFILINRLITLGFQSGSIGPGGPGGPVGPDGPCGPDCPGGQGGPGVPDGQGGQGGQGGQVESGK